MTLQSKPRFLTPCDVEPLPYATTVEDIRLYIRGFESDQAIIAYFQIGAGLVESFLKWRFPQQFPESILAVRDHDTVTASILANGRQFRLPRHLAMYTYFFYELHHDRVGDPCTRGQWVTAGRELWEPFRRAYEKKEAWMKETGRTND